MWLCKHIATMMFIMSNLKVVRTIILSRYQISALSVVAMARNLASIIFQNISGQVIDAYSYSSFFMMLFIFAVLGLIIVYFFKLPNDQGIELFD